LGRRFRTGSGPWRQEPNRGPSEGGRVRRRTGPIPRFRQSPDPSRSGNPRNPSGRTAPGPATWQRGRTSGRRGLPRPAPHDTRGNTDNARAAARRRPSGIPGQTLDEPEMPDEPAGMSRCGLRGRPVHGDAVGHRGSEIRERGVVSLQRTDLIDNLHPAAVEPQSAAFTAARSAGRSDWGLGAEPPMCCREAADPRPPHTAQIR
jgi:hypothetical protein